MDRVLEFIGIITLIVLLVNWIYPTGYYDRY